MTTRRSTRRSARQATPVAVEFAAGTVQQSSRFWCRDHLEPVTAKGRGCSQCAAESYREPQRRNVDDEAAW